MNLFPGESTCNAGSHVCQWEEQASSGGELTPRSEDMKKEYQAFMKWWEEQRFPALVPFGPDYPRDAKRVKAGARKSRITLESVETLHNGRWETHVRVVERFLE